MCDNGCVITRQGNTFTTYVYMKSQWILEIFDNFIGQLTLSKTKKGKKKRAI